MRWHADIPPCPLFWFSISPPNPTTYSFKGIGTLTPQSADAGPQQAYTGHTNARNTPRGHQVKAGLPSQIWHRFWFPTRTRLVAASLRWTATRNFPPPPFKSKLVKQELWAPLKHPRESSNNIDSGVRGAHVGHQHNPRDFKCKKAHY